MSVRRGPAGRAGDPMKEMDIRNAVAIAIYRKALIRRRCQDWPAHMALKYFGDALLYCSLDGGKVYRGIYRPTLLDIMANDWEVVEIRRFDLWKTM